MIKRLTLPFAWATLILTCHAASNACDTTYDPKAYIDRTGQDPSLLIDRRQFPKYGGLKITEAQAANDLDYLAKADQYFSGDRKKAANEVAAKGWQLFRVGDVKTAMSRWNQAWMLDNCNGKALWGFSLVQYDRQKPDEAMALLSEAKAQVGDDVDFLADEARLYSMEAVRTHNDKQMDRAFDLFAAVYAHSPQHVMNLQNWAIAYFYVGRYADSWEKIRLAEAAPRANELDKRFIAALGAKMPRQ